MPRPRISVTVRVLTVLQRHPTVLMSPCEVARALNLHSGTVRVLLGRLCDRGDATTDGRGRYRVHSPEPEVTIWDLTMQWRR